MHHLLAYAGSVAQNASLAAVPAIVDQVLAQFTATTYTPEKKLRILRSYAMGDSISQIRFDSPLLRLIGPPQVQPIDVAVEPSTLPPINKYDGNALFWQANDPLSMLCSRAGAGAANVYCLHWLAPDMQQKIDGPTFAVRATYTATLTATSWVPATLTFDQSLPPGNYKIVGMSAICGDLLAARLILPNQVYRPGCLAQDLDSQWDWEWFRRGNFGDYGSFQSYSPPTIELMGHTAGAETGFVWLDLQPQFATGGF